MRVNIMVDVSEEIYYKVVEPYKKEKKFKLLVERLLNGYLENEVISSYVEGSFDAMHKGDMQSFNDAIAKMKGNLANMGILNDAASSMMEAGRRVVSLDKEEKKSGAEATPVIEAKKVASVGKETNTPSRDEKVYEEIDALKKQNQDMLEKFSTLAKMIEEMGNTAKAKEATKSVVEKEPEVVSAPVVEEKKSVAGEAKEDVKPVLPSPTADPLDVAMDVDDPLAAPIDLFDDSEIPNILEDEEEDSDAAEDDFFNNMLDGQVYSF